VTVARPADDGDELEGPEAVELLEVVDLDEPQDLGHGLTVDATVAKPRPRRKRATDIPPPRRWPRVGHQELRSCVVCHCAVANIKEAFWHMQASHGGDTPDDVDADEWAEDLQQEVQEFRDYVRSGKARTWRTASPDPGLQGSHMAAALLGVVVVMVLVGIIYILANTL
jgi:hypothetical protein